MAAEAYCTKCRTKREIQEAKEVTLANGRRALQGTCPVCGTKLLRFVAGAPKAAAGHGRPAPPHELGHA